MSIHVAVNHVTHYRYDRRVSLGPQVVRLRPAPHARTRILSYSLRVEPAQHFVNWQQDPQANYLARLVIPEPTSELRVEVDLVAEMAVQNPFDFFLEPTAECLPIKYTEAQRRELAPFLERLPGGDRFDGFLSSIDLRPRGTVEFLVDLNRRVQQEISYLIRLEAGVQAPEETLQLGSGSCRDSGWLLVQLLRHLGLAARFVSGYLIQLRPDEQSIDGPSGVTADFTDLHAWCEVYLPWAGWIGLDPTSGLLAGEGHIPVACSPDPSSAAPISGALEACEVEFEHQMRVTRIRETPRVTQPYDEADWQAVLALGDQVDADLVRHDVRLTQGGEPTFVALDDRDSAEWNTDALGPTKRGRALDLIERLRARYAPFGLFHFGQGKWYPGEQLPRWSLNLFWRRDGLPLWSDRSLMADERSPGRCGERDALRFLQGLTARLGLDVERIFPAFEDAFYYLWRERRLPVNVDPFESRLDDPLERARLRRVFEARLDSVVGYVLPIARERSEPRFRTGSWFLREERCYLVPGDSPLGFRLPLDSQPWVAPGDRPWISTPDPWQARPALADPAQIALQVAAVAAGQAEAQNEGSSAKLRSGESADTAPAPWTSASGIVRTALCVEARAGHLYVFMPPTSELEHYLELVAAVEATARSQGVAVILEGYEPPRDNRLTMLRVTPDPGVIEVNIQPVERWSELVEQTQVLYEAARQSRLSPEKFMLDGRHTGTGGGNHLVLGATSPADSPFLRRPDVLASLMAYWHNHPALSYLFSGLFIGPTSQAPRIDEARNDSLYEIEIAFAELARLDGSSDRPWQVDRILRNLLIDVTGNTHRAEFCIDKLYSPDSASGRLGLLELRAFEMPPHPKMSLVQQLLLRALLARFWQQPYRPVRLQRWGTELHDRFMLPHFIWLDFQDIIQELAIFGYPFRAEWFAPHFEFRFPRLGDFAVQDVHVELRLALEPWHVMGEETSSGGTVRYVDSSLERLQVRATGLIEGRHQLTCNTRRVPLHPTGRVGEFVAGVRYKAWWPASSLHPTIPAHGPLTFDLMDTWSGRSLGGCQYHVAHPGGRNYASAPVNAYEAEARRLARFFRLGHTPGDVQSVTEARNPDFPFTLDLRREPS
jgi:uncharacterized protein (DUF2126 family)